MRPNISFTLYFYFIRRRCSLANKSCRSDRRVCFFSSLLQNNFKLFISWKRSNWTWEPTSLLHQTKVDSKRKSSWARCSLWIVMQKLFIAMLKYGLYFCHSMFWSTIKNITENISSEHLHAIFDVIPFSVFLLNILIRIKSFCYIRFIFS